ncbi:MAG: hypothetical protein Kow0080_17370 [Candidatus Promineifilaceae bacterium]
MRKIRMTIGLLLILIGLIGGATAKVSAATTANTGVTGRVVDGKTAQPWVYGAEVVAIQTTITPGFLGTTTLAADGTFTINYSSSGTPTDDLNMCASVGGCVAPQNFANVQVLIVFTCDINTSNGTRSNYQTSNDSNCPLDPLGAATSPVLTGLPNNMEVQYTDTFVGTVRNLGDIDTNRGPTAVSLQTITAASTTNWLLILLPMLFIMTGGWLLVKRPTVARQPVTRQRS